MVHFSSKIASCCEVFEAVEIVPVACSSSTRIMVHHLRGKGERNGGEEGERMRKGGEEKGSQPNI